ncbi:MAG TPA: hypothetical protein P5561_03080 [Candidatus Omnitrophota bacterium]|nr:hypothetical protein [Candidatus Omnitrophota bacterium]HRY85497.1 hypothetical protein [Candidatus Omnitrophota bacterium]
MMRKSRVLKKIGLGIGGGLLCFAAVAPVLLAREAGEIKTNPETFYSEFFEQSFYDEGVNLLDFGRWGRKIFRQEIPSANVNVFDEVPDSSFFTNRHGRKRLSAEEIEKGYRENNGPDLSQPLRVIEAEQRGIYPRFWVKDAQDEEYLLEFDPQIALDLSTGAELVASRFYYALGYHVPQYTPLFFNPDQIQAVSAAMTWEDTGFKKPLTQKRLMEYLLVLPQNAQGLYRASAQKIPQGEKKGPFSFEKRRKDDPEDIVNHRDRREIRALGIFASWLNHFDLCETSTQDFLVHEGGQNVLKHYLMDFNGALGATREGPKDPMLGHEHAVDYGETLKTMFLLGFREKPWQKKWREDKEIVPGSPAVGYFTNQYFDPAGYKTFFPYESLRMATRADGFWAAKLLADFSDADIRAAVKAGEYENPEDAEAIAKTLIERRDIIVRHWFSCSSPLDQFESSGGRLSFKDLAVEKGFESGDGTLYRAEIFTQGKKGKKIAELEAREPLLALDPSWTAAGSGVRVILRTLRPSSKKPGPAVEILLNADGVQGIRHED